MERTFYTVYNPGAWMDREYQDSDKDLWRKMTLIRAHELFVLWRDVVVSPEVDRDKLLADTREWLADYEQQFEVFVDGAKDE